MRESPEEALPTNVAQTISALQSPTQRRWAHLVCGIASLTLAGCGLQYIPTDLRINRLCKKDGGVTVFEKVKAPNEYLGPNGRVNGDDLLRLPNREYYATGDAKSIQVGAPSLKRIEYTLHRRSDGKVLARSVYYLRPWDGLPDLLWSRSHACPENGGLGALADAAFVR